MYASDYVLLFKVTHQLTAYFIIKLLQDSTISKPLHMNHTLPLDCRMTIF